MSWDPRDKVAVVIGASSGIGEATARRLARAGMTVVAAARREQLLTALAADHPSIVPAHVDVTEVESVDALARRVDDEFGACHGLVNSAGVGGGSFRGREDLDDALATIDVNLNGTIRCMAAFSQLLCASAPSRVVNIASVAGKLGIGPAGYAASKFGVVGFSEATAFSFRPRGVTVCQLNPGMVETEGFPQEQIKRTPLAGVVAEPALVARAVHEALVSGRTERMVPGWYRGFVVARHVAAPIYRAIASRLERAGGSRE